MCYQWNSIQCGECRNVTESISQQYCPQRCLHYSVQPGRLERTHCSEDACGSFVNSLEKRFKDAINKRPPKRADEPMLKAIHRVLLHADQQGIPRRVRDIVHQVVMSKWIKRGVICKFDEEMILAGCSLKAICEINEMVTRSYLNIYSEGTSDYLQ